MKLLFLVSNLMSGGVERTVVYLSSYFASNGIDVEILTLSNEIFYSVDPRVKITNFKIPRNYTNMIERIKRAVLRYRLVNNYLANNSFDVVFCMVPEMIRYISRRVQHKFKLITSERNNPLFDSKRDKRIKKSAFKRCDGIIFQTKRARNCFPLNIQKKGIVIPNAVGNDFAYKILSKPTKKTISAVGRLSKQKDYPTLLKAFSLFNRKVNGYTLEIFGNGEEKEYLLKLSKELGIADSVIFYKASPNAIEMISNSSLYVLSSIYEGMPNALMEAMAIGLPCISTDCQFGPAELINDRVNGLLVPVSDYHSLAKAMQEMVTDKELSNRCSRNARRILDTNSIDIIAKRFLNYVIDFAK